MGTNVPGKEYERDLQKKVLKYLKNTLPEEESFFWKVSERYHSGIPDIVGFCKGRPFAVELKVGKNIPTELQALTIRKMSKSGVYAAVCYSVEEVQKFIERYVL